MAEIYGYLWGRQYGHEPADTWRQGLADISPEAMAVGISRCVERGDKFPPNLLEFRELCTRSPADFGLPTEDAAWREANNASSSPATWLFTHQAIQLAALSVGWYDLRRGIPNTENVRRRFVAAYQVLVAKACRGETLEEPKKMLEHEGKTLTVAQAERAGDVLLVERIRRQGLAEKTPQEARQELLETMGIRR